MTRSFALPRLVCPETHQPLAQADAALVEQLNAAIARGQLKFTLGEFVGQRLDGGFVRGDGLVLYPIVHGIPHLTIDQAITLDQVNAP